LAGLLTFGGVVLLKTFLFGIVLGILAAAGILYAYPAVDQQREASLVSVAPNGGTRETFHINIPMDRIMLGAPGQDEPVPPGLEWPDDRLLSSIRVELFKLRNARDAVIGVAARTAAQDGDATVIDWVLHLPARGSVFINMQAVPEEGGYRLGYFRAGSREFEPLSGFLTERWVSDTSGDEDAPAGRIELQAGYASKQEPPE
jgi:hypothetical protein